MYILCDTSSILLLIRIAPDMFIDERYECLTIYEVRDEIFRTPRFKSKYSWRIDFKNKIKVTNIDETKKSDFEVHLNLIKNLN